MKKILLTFFLLLNVSAPLVQAEKFPDRPISLIVPYAPGGPTDQHLRIIAEDASKTLGQAIVIENRLGANGTNGASTLAKATPDGYTIALLPASVYREPFINKVTYNVLNDFAYILMLSDYTFGLAVKADAPWKNWADFVKDAKNRPGAISIGATGAIGTPRVVVDEVAAMANIKINSIPYKGDADVATAILGGHIDAGNLSGIAVPHIEAGMMHYLVMLTQKRVKRFANIPTLSEEGIKHWVESPYGVAAPTGTDPARLKLIHDAFKKGLESTASQELMTKLNQQMDYMNPTQYRDYVIKTTEKEKFRVAKLRELGLID